MTTAPDDDAGREYAGGLRKRLERIAADSSQAEIARRTGTWVSNVNHYLKGRRIPAEFCCALIDAFGINPAWLLMGEGTPYVADVTARTAATASHLLELVEAMNAVTRTRIGSLAGKEHRKVLKQLSDALIAYNHHRSRLTEHIEPIFTELMDMLRDAMIGAKYDYARQLASAAKQVEPLCDTLELKVDFERWCARLEFATGDHVAAASIQRRMLMRQMVEDADFHQDTQVGATNFVAVLESIGRFDEASRFAKAAYALGEGQEGWWRGRFVFLEGHIDIQLGRVSDGLSKMLHGWRWLDDASMYYVVMLMDAQLFAGAIDLQQAAMARQFEGFRMQPVLWHAIWREDIETLERAMALEILEKVERLLRTRLLHPFARHVLDAFKGRRTKSNVEDFRKTQEFAQLEASSLPVARIEASVASCHLARLCRQSAAAVTWLNEARERIAALPAGILPELRWRALYHLNTRALGADNLLGAESAQLAAEAQRFFDDAYLNGAIAFKAQASAGVTARDMGTASRRSGSGDATPAAT